MHQLLVSSVLAFSPANDVEVNLLLNFFGIQRTSYNVNDLFDWFDDFLKHFFFGSFCMNVTLHHSEYFVVQNLQHDLCLVLKCLRDVSCDYIRIIVKELLFRLEVDVRVVHDMVLSHEHIRIVDEDRTLTCDRAFPDVDRNLQIKMHVLDVLVQKQQPARIDLEVCVGDLKLLVSK